jgi:hypothetical protein
VSELVLKSRKVYNKPLSKRMENIEIDTPTLMEFGRVICDAIKHEIAVDIGRGRMSGRGLPTTLTEAHKIGESLQYRVVNNSLEFYSEHPLIRKFTEGQSPFVMRWLDWKRGLRIIPIMTLQGLIFRMAPGGPKKGGGPPSPLWIHPGFRKYNFFERGVRKGREEVVRKFYERVVLPQLARTDFLL